jgi:hypothetical protein
MEAGGNVAIVPIYQTIYSDQHEMSYSLRVSDGDGVQLFVLAVNVPSEPLNQYVSEMSITKNSYGILESENSDIMAHPYPEYIGKNMSEVNANLFSFANEVREGRNLSEHVVTDYKNQAVVVFTSRLDNNWVLSIAIPPLASKFGWN